MEERASNLSPLGLFLFEVRSMEQPLFKRNKVTMIKGVIFLCFLFVVIVGTFMALPTVVSFASEEKRNAFSEDIHLLGFWGWGLIFLLEILQMIFAFIPGELTEILAGMMYGWNLGFLTVFLASTLGTLFIFFFSRKFGRPFVNLFIKEDSIKHFSFLEKEENMDLLVFLLYFIPGAPKDALTYIIPLTKMKASHFIILSLIGRIPSLLTASVAGASIMEGNFLLTFVIFGVTGFISLVGLLLNWMKRRKEKVESKSVDNNTIEE